MSGVRLLDYWSPPDGAGQAVACLATTFTFESDFFTQDCLSRFLSLSTAAGEGDAISSIAAVLEEEDRLSEAQVSVLIDRSTPAEKRNLRWDLLPVSAPGGLLHAKVTALLWERSARLFLGSANLTSAGYRRQVEAALAIDLDENCRVPRPVIDELIAEIRRFVDLVPGPPTGPKGRALDTVDRLTTYVDMLALPRASRGDIHLAVAPARPGISPIDRLADVWRGGQPLWATVLSPFWDDTTPAPALGAVRRRLTGRPASQRSMRCVVAVDPFTGTVQAPASLTTQPGTDVVAFEPRDSEPRALHAKLLLVESGDWLAALIGSSNATGAGLGLHPNHGHHELNVWLGCPAKSRTAKHLRALAPMGEAIELDGTQCEPALDEDEPTTPILPVGFVECVIYAQTPPRVVVELLAESLPRSWMLRTPSGQQLLTSDQWRGDGVPRSKSVFLPNEVLPSYLVVQWIDDGGSVEATWVANVGERGALPPPADLADLSVDVLLAALASTRPLPIALERELRRRQRVGDEEGSIDLDPLRRFDDSGLLLQRARHLSLALWRLQERLSRPTTSVDALRWRLEGVLGPLAIADGLVHAAAKQETLPGEAHFLLAELALTVSAVDWPDVTKDIDTQSVRTLVAHVLGAIQDRRKALPPSPDAALDKYVRAALKKARS